MNSIHAIKNETIGLCVSGGLDSKTLARRLMDEKINVLCFVADLGQPDIQDIEEVRSRMQSCGVETIVVDLRNAMATACMDSLITQATYNGGYWNTTGLARAVTVRGLLPEMQKRGCTILSHGATGRGNDQIRFERYTNILSPEMGVYAPWRDPDLLQEFPGRKEMIEYLERAGIKEFAEKKKRYSTDANLAGVSHEAEDLESLTTPCTIVKPTMGVWPHDAPDDQEECTIDFDQGIPVAINGKKVTHLSAMEDANKIGGRNGIGIKNALENRIIGTKSRGVYEAPGMELIGFCLSQVYQAILNRQATELFEYLSRFIAQQVYDGRYYDPATSAARTAINAFATCASGKVTVKLYKGNIYFQALKECSASLYHEADASMEASDGLSPLSSQGFVEIQRAEAVQIARQIHGTL